MKRVLLVFSLLCLAGLAGGAVYGRHWLTAALAAPNPRAKDPVTVIVEPGTSPVALARQLRQQGLINHERAFLLTARYLKLDHRLQAGGYRFTPAEGAVKILRRLAAGDVYVEKLTIAEGLTLAEVAAQVDTVEWLTGATFLKLAQGSAPLPNRPDWAPSGSLEGFLFPETYQVPLGSTEAELLHQMLARFKKVVVDGLAEELKETALTLKQVVTLASIVEREARRQEEQPRMAGVFLNRLAKGMKLESCATVQYALPHRKDRLLYADLELKSPYNTYLHAGLPPGPIASPGKSAVVAVLKPATTTALYFVARADGSHIFSDTLQQHNAAKLAVRQAAGSN